MPRKRGASASADPGEPAAASNKGKSPAKEPAKIAPPVVDDEHVVVVSKELESTITTRAGKYSKTELEYQVNPKYKLDRINMDQVALEISQDMEVQSNSSWDSDLDFHVEAFSPAYASLQHDDKHYVIANIRHMLSKV